MKHIVYETSNQYPIVILLKENALDKISIYDNYIEPLINNGIKLNEILILSLDYFNVKIPKVAQCKEYLNTILTVLQDVKAKHIYCADSFYFKIITGETKPEKSLGYTVQSKLDNWQQYSITYGINHKSIFFNPKNSIHLTTSLTALINYINKGTNAFKPFEFKSYNSYYISKCDFSNLLDQLHQYDSLAVDIETNSLNWRKAKLKTIAFSWNAYSGVSFIFDYVNNYTPLRRFFQNYKGKLIFHNASYDIKILIKQLWLFSSEEKINILNYFTKNFEDTRLMAYFCLNSTIKESYSLKNLTHSFLGDYAIDFNSLDINIEELAEYNAKDTCGTYWLYEKFSKELNDINLMDTYKNLGIKSCKTLIYTELNGMPLNPEQCHKADYELTNIINNSLAYINNHPTIQSFNSLLAVDRLTDDFERRKAKAVNPHKIKQRPEDYYDDTVFNPNSNLQLQKLLFRFLNLPILEYTQTKQPSTGSKILQYLTNHTDDLSIKKLLSKLIEFNKAIKIKSTYLSAFKDQDSLFNYSERLYGEFTLGGTISFRLSSKKPNLQNLPSNSTYGKLIKECIQAPKGWLIIGADFDSLEDKANALVTKDPQKLKVYTDGYDGHSLRAFSYFKEQMPDIKNTVKSINSIENKYPTLRQNSKAPTFALTYFGTYLTLMKNCGFSEEEAKSIEANYHKLYKVSDKWAEKQLKRGEKLGYVTGAFGIRLKTPLLKKFANELRKPQQYQAERRSAGNFLTQSYCALNLRATNDFMEKVWNSEYKYDVKPIAQIHDASYYLIRDNIDIVQWCNTELIKSMSWQDLPELQHEKVKISAKMEVYKGSWANPIKLPNNATKEEILSITKNPV